MNEPPAGSLEVCGYITGVLPLWTHSTSDMWLVIWGVVDNLINWDCHMWRSIVQWYIAGPPSVVPWERDCCMHGIRVFVEVGALRRVDRYCINEETFSIMINATSWLLLKCTVEHSSLNRLVSLITFKPLLNWTLTGGVSPGDTANVQLLDFTKMSLANETSVGW